MAGFAWVTLATNDSYSLGALVLAHSLRRVGSKHDLAVLVTPGVTGAMREKLASVFSLVQEVNVLDSKDEANLALLARPELGITFTKLHCWRLTQYEKCVFVDADTLVIRNCDELFEREELSAAPDVGWPDCFNSGVFVFKPSQQTFASITAFAATKGSFDGGDQGLLNQYFSDWAHKDISKHLPFIYNMCSTATYSYLPAFKQFGEDVRIIHFIGITKPWLQYFDTVTGQVQPAPGSNHLQPLLQLWWHIFCENVHPQLSPVMASSTLASVWHESHAYPPSSPPARPQDPNDMSYNDIRSTEPDFSEFQDPWENYGRKSSQTCVNVESSDGRSPSGEKTDTNHFSSGRSDDHYHQPQCAIQRQFDSQNHPASDERHHRHPSVLDDSRNKTQDNSDPPTIEHRNFADHSREHHSHQDTQRQNTSQTTCNYGGEDDRRVEDFKGESQHRHEQNYPQEQNYKSEYHGDRNDHREQIYHNTEFHCEQNNHQEQIYHKPEYHHEQKHQEQNHYEQNHHEQNHHEQNHHEQNHHEQNHHEQNHHDNNHRNHEDVRQEQRHHDHQQDDRSHQNYCHQNHTVDDSNSQPFDRSKNFDHVENTAAQNSHDNRERESEENRLQDRSNVDYREKQTDVNSTTETHLTVRTTESRSPPAPCSKSQCTATQSEPNIAGQLESNDAGIAGALAKITLGEARSPEQVAFEEHMRKQSWEQGQIDYMGRDSFDNIWKKISETLGVQTQRQPSPPKTLPKPEETKVGVATPVATEDQPAAKRSEAAVPAEPREKEEQDLTKSLAPGEAEVAPQIAQLGPEKITTEAATIPAQSPISDAAVTPVALAQIVPQVPAATPETSVKSDDDTSATTPLDSSIKQAAEILLQDIQVVEAAKTDSPKAPEAAATPARISPAEEKSPPQKDAKIEEIRLSESSQQIVADSPVPIQVAESVLEAEVKESVTEDLRPVTEEAISSISVSAQESVPAVLETVMQAAVAPPASTPNGAAVLDPISEIGNGIDALSLSAPIAVAPAIVAVARTEEIPPAATQEAERKEETSAIQAASLETPETQESAPVLVEPIPEAEITTEVRQTSSAVEATAEPAKTETEQPKVSALEAQEEISVLPSVQSSEKPEEPKTPSEAEKLSPIAAEATKTPQEVKLPLKSEEPSSPPVELPASPIPTPLAVTSEETKVPAKLEEPTEKLAEIQPPRPEEPACPIKPKIAASVKPEEKASSLPVVEAKPEEVSTKKEVPKDEEPAACPIKPKIAASAQPEEKTSSLPVVEAKPEEVSTKKEVPKEEPVACPIKPKISAKPEEKAGEGVSKKKVPKDESKESETSEELASQSESSEESPVRPARTKEQQQIPGTPIVTEATPPTSPPIGAPETFAEPPPTTTKTTKKVVKKVTKKTTADGAEGATEGEAKKATKKVVKKVTKKTKEDDGAEASGATEKPKKVVKVLKKTTKVGQTLEADATVPETPPPGAPEVPVPPKRKLKTAGKSTPAKSEPEP